MSKPSCSASSSYSNIHNMWLAVDGCPWSRWMSEWQKDPQWFAIDLGKAATVKSVAVVWSKWGRAAESAIAVSKDGSDWKQVGCADNGDPKNLFDEFTFAPQRGVRHVRIDCLKRTDAEHGYSIVQILVNGRKVVAYPPLTKVEAPKAPFRNKTLAPEKRARDLVSRLTFDELLDITGGFASFFIWPLARFGLPAISFSDASMGVRMPDNTPAHQSVSFPASVALAATWNPAMGAKYGKSIGQECRIHGVHTLLGPGVNIYRTATNGRNFEYLSEDPFLTSRMAVSYIKALQSTGTMACIKHFACNNNEWIRHNINTIVDDRAMQEIYLPAFRAAIAEADVKAVMTSYNYWRGEKASQNRELIEDVLRKDLGFKNLIMSDWDAVWDGEKVLASGQDLVMPHNNMVRKYVTDHPERKADVEARLKRMALSILRTIMAMGYYDRVHVKPDWTKRRKQHEEVALEVAGEAITLLKNNDVLPLAPRKVKSILMIGPAARKTPNSGGGSGHVQGYNRVRYYDGLHKIVGDKVQYMDDPSDEDIRAAGVVIVCPYMNEQENTDRWFEFPDEQEALIKRAVSLNSKTIVVITQGGGVRMTDWADAAGAIVYAYYTGQTGGTALAAVLFGKVNPSGKLPFSIERNFGDSPAARYLPEFIRQERNLKLLGEGDETRKRLQERGLKLPHDLTYSEGIFVGYRWYDSKNIHPLFCFGHGLSYTTFEYSDLKLPKTVKLKAGKLAGAIEVSLSVKNTGRRSGAEVVQLYVGDQEASADRPLRELKGFAKVTLNPGQKKRVKFTVDQSALSFWHPEKKAWTLEKGTFTVEAGSSSRDLRLKGVFALA